jgi:arylsulfatase A-like enzyme
MGSANVANSPLVSQITLKSNTTVRMTTAKQYDYGGKTIDAPRRGDWKLLQDSPFKSLELYDLKTDPGETTDLAGKERQRFNELAAALREHLQRGDRCLGRRPKGDARATKFHRSWQPISVIRAWAARRWRVSGLELTPFRRPSSVNALPLKGRRWPPATED